MNHRIRSTVAVLCFLAAPVAFAQSRPVFGTAPMPCLTHASAMMNEQLLRVIPDSLLAGMRDGLGKDASWKRGEPNYEKVRAIVVDMIAAEERKGGPLFNLTVDQMLAEVVSRWSADEQRHYTAFFARPGGRLYLSHGLNGVLCEGWAAAMNQPPFLPLDAQRRAYWIKLLIPESMEPLEKKFSGLPKEEQQSVNAEYPKLNQAFESVLKNMSKKSNPIVFARLKAAVEPRMKEMIELARSVR